MSVHLLSRRRQVAAPADLASPAAVSSSAPMTVFGPARQPGSSASTVASWRACVSGLRPVEQICYVTAAVLALSGLLHLGVFVLSDRPWQGPLSWRKPATFGLSFGTTLATITWVSSHQRVHAATRVALLAVFSLDCVLEVGGITVQAWRDVPSHFNTQTPFDAGVAYSLALGGAVLILVLGTLAVTAFRGRVEGPASLRLAVQAGFALLLAGLLAGVAMIARGTVLVRNGDPQAGYDQAGFLKAFHGVTLHAILVLPALAWWLARKPSLSESRRVRLVRAVTTTYVLAACVVLAVSIRQ